MDLIALVTARLKTSVHILSNRVAGVTELEDAISATKFIAPYAFVLTLDESAGENELVNMVMQRVTVTLGVVLAISNGAHPLNLGAGGNPNRLQEFKDAVKSALLGWTPDPSCDNLTYKGGKLAQVHNRILWWQESFETSFYIRST